MKSLKGLTRVVCATRDAKGKVTRTRTVYEDFKACKTFDEKGKEIKEAVR